MTGPRVRFGGGRRGRSSGKRAGFVAASWCCRMRGTRGGWWRSSSCCALDMGITAVDRASAPFRGILVCWYADTCERAYSWEDTRIQKRKLIWADI